MGCPFPGCADRYQNQFCRLHKLTNSYIDQLRARFNRAGPAMNDAELSATAVRSVLVGLIGAGIQASRSPAMHEREGAAQSLAYLYRLIDLDVLGLSTEALPELLAWAYRFGF